MTLLRRFPRSSFRICASKLLLLLVLNPHSVFAEERSAESADQRQRVDVDDKIRERVRERLAQSGHAVRKIEGELDIGSVWTLKRLLDFAPNAEMKRYVDAQTEMKKKHQYYRLLNNSAPRPTLPAKLGTGLNKTIAYTLSSIADPEDKAMKYFREYLESDFKGYHLTHQLMAMDWSVRSGRKIPDDLVPRREELVRRVVEEQSSDDVFSDLYAERAATALLLGNAPREAMLNWADTVMKNVDSSGLWISPKVTVTFDGKSFESSPQPAHTSALSLLFLALFLEHTH